MDERKQSKPRHDPGAAPKDENIVEVGDEDPDDSILGGGQATHSPPLWDEPWPDLEDGPELDSTDPPGRDSDVEPDAPGAAPRSAPAPDYKVGYRKPPEHARYQKGQSGNPGGRPKKLVSMAEIWSAELQKPIEVIEGDRKTTISRSRALVRSTILAGIKGDSRARSEVLKRTEQLGVDTRDATDQEIEEDRRRRETLELLDKVKPSYFGFPGKV